MSFPNRLWARERRLWPVLTWALAPVPQSWCLACSGPSASIQIVTALLMELWAHSRGVCASLPCPPWVSVTEQWRVGRLRPEFKSWWKGPHLCWEWGEGDMGCRGEGGAACWERMGCCSVAQSCPTLWDPMDGRLLSSCSTWTLGRAGSIVVDHWLSCPEACGISPTRNGTCMSCIRRQILNPWTTMKALNPDFSVFWKIL